MPDLASLDSSLIFAFIAAAFFAFWILMATIHSCHKTAQRERTTRELAAYIAEGAITPDQAEQLISARARSDLREELSSKAAAGWISTKNARRLMDEDAHPPRRPVPSPHAPTHASPHAPPHATGA